MQTDELAALALVSPIVLDIAHVVGKTPVVQRIAPVAHYGVVND